MYHMISYGVLKTSIEGIRFSGLTCGWCIGDLAWAPAVKTETIVTHVPKAIIFVTWSIGNMHDEFATMN